MLLDITGQKFGRMTAIEISHRNGKGRVFWKCRCDCGKEKAVSSWHLRLGGTKSCGCLHTDFARSGKHSRKHGDACGGELTSEYWRWQSMKARCYNPNTKSYPAYGGRGISICERWLKDYGAFLSDMGRCPEGFMLDRIDVNGNYEPGNCRWVSLSDSLFNRRPRGNQITHDGKTMNQKQWAEQLGISMRRLKTKLRKGTFP